MNRTLSVPLSSNVRAAQQAISGTIAIGALLYFAVILVALHFLRADTDPIALPTSFYALGPYGFLMTSAFFSMSLATWALIAGLYPGIRERARSRMGLGLLGLWAGGVLIAMLFPLDPVGAAQTVAGTIHRVDGPLAFLCMTAGTLLVSWRLQYAETWRPWHRTALMLSLMMLAAYVSTFVAMATQSQVAGLMQRIDLTALVTWMLLMAFRLRSLPQP